LFRPLRLLALLLIVLPFSAQAGPPPNWEPADGRVALPVERFTNSLGVEMSLADFRGKVVALNLWATWCAPCVREMPDLDRLQAKIGGASFEVIALSSDRGGLSKVEPFFRRTGIEHLEIYLDPKNTIARRLGARGLPTTFIIDAEGRILGSVAGAMDWSADPVVEWLKGIIARQQQQATAE
jgi:thiol-disulfide isomerase/thioredoxin